MIMIRIYCQIKLPNNVIHVSQSKLAFENQNAMGPDDDRISKWAMVSLTEKYNLKKLCFRPNAETKIEKFDV